MGFCSIQYKFASMALTSFLFHFSLSIEMPFYFLRA